MILLQFWNKTIWRECIYGSRYSRRDQVKLFKGCLPEILLGPEISLEYLDPYVTQKQLKILYNCISMIFPNAERNVSSLDIIKSSTVSWISPLENQRNFWTQTDLTCDYYEWTWSFQNIFDSKHRFHSFIERGGFQNCFISFPSEKHVFITIGFFLSGKYSLVVINRSIVSCGFLFTRK